MALNPGVLELHNLFDYEKHAKDQLPRQAFDYYASGANDMITLRENRKAFSYLTIRPRSLKNVHKIDLQTTILGDKVSQSILPIHYL